MSDTPCNKHERHACAQLAGTRGSSPCMTRLEAHTVCVCHGGVSVCTCLTRHVVGGRCTARHTRTCVHPAPPLCRRVLQLEGVQLCLLQRKRRAAEPPGRRARGVRVWRLQGVHGRGQEQAGALGFGLQCGHGVLGALAAEGWVAVCTGRERVYLVSAAHSMSDAVPALCDCARIAAPQHVMQASGSALTTLHA